MHKRQDKLIILWIARVRKAAFELDPTPAPISELDQILVITDGLPDEYAPVVSKLDDVLFMQLNLRDVITQITGREAQLQRDSDKLAELSTEATALYARTRMPKNTANPDAKCYNCGGLGHHAAICLSPPRSEKAHIAAMDEDSQILFPKEDTDSNTLTLF